VYITVLNVESHSAKNLSEFWPPYHFFYFSPQTIKKMLKKVGFSIEKLIVNPHVPSIISRNTLYRKIRWLVRMTRKIVSFDISKKFIPKLLSGGITVIVKRVDYK